MITHKMVSVIFHDNCWLGSFRRWDFLFVPMMPWEWTYDFGTLALNITMGRLARLTTLR
jgi:hypothetical protein